MLAPFPKTGTHENGDMNGSLFPNTQKIPLTFIIAEGEYSGLCIVKAYIICELLVIRVGKNLKKKNVYSYMLKKLDIYFKKVNFNKKNSHFVS